MEDNNSNQTTTPLIDLSEPISLETTGTNQSRVVQKREKLPLWKSPTVISMAVVLGTCLVVMMIAIIVSVIQSRIIHKYKYDQKKKPPQIAKKETPMEQRDVSIHSEPRFSNSYEDEDPGDPEEMLEIASKLCSPELDPGRIDDEKSQSNSDVLRAIKTMRELNQSKNSSIPKKVMNQEEIMIRLQACKKDKFTKNELFKGIVLATNGVLTDEEFNNICNEKMENHLRKSSDRTEVSDVVSIGVEEPVITKELNQLDQPVQPVKPVTIDESPFIDENHPPKSINKAPRFDFEVMNKKNL